MDMGSRDGAAVVRALTSHKCGPGSIPGFTCGLSLMLVLVLAPRGFSSGTPVFPSPQKPTFPNSNSIRIINCQALYHEPLAREIVQTLSVSLTLNKLPYYISQLICTRGVIGQFCGPYFTVRTAKFASLNSGLEI